ncbi:MAG TPA: hypothetical protein VG713_11130 [Pirellulales bacterium]|nr:hypothetical protein [Pirellulales bacterium]
MKNTILGAVLGALLVATVTALPAMSRVDAMPAVASSSEMLVFPIPVGDRHQLVVIDPRQRVLGVYQIDAPGGEIALKSVRNIHWDLQLSEFNSAAPLPREIRSLVDQR